jgi:hypothetical protein
VDESATGSANFLDRRLMQPGWVASRGMHLRPPSFDHGTVSGLWAIGFGLFIVFGSIAVGVEKSTAIILGAISAGVIFLFVRLYGEEQLRR